MPKAPTEIRSIARSHTESALRVLAGIMNEATAPHAARVAAANSILDRGWGKAIQAVEVSGEIASKVIRAPAVSVTVQAWTDQHAPEQHRTEH